MRRADRQYSRRRTVDPSRDGYDRRGLVAQKRYVYLCTNAILLERKLDEYPASKFLTFSVHMDGLQDEHDLAVCRDGVYDVAVRAIKAALKRGHRVTTNTTLFDDANPERVQKVLRRDDGAGRRRHDDLARLQLSKGAGPAAFPQASRTKELFSKILGSRKRGWQFNQSPLFLEFLMGKREYQCTPWGNPTYNVFGWQRPCYLLQEGYAELP